MADSLRTVADPTRRRMLEFLIVRGGPATVDEVAVAHGLHRTVAFEHLELLAGVGLLLPGDRPGRRGRPARTYRFAGSALEASYPQRQYRLLSSLLAGAGISKPAARRAGDAYGRKLAAGRRGETEAIECLESLGARYVARGPSILAQNCVFAEACLTAGPVICELQAGLLQGALAAAGSAWRVTAQGSDGGGGCGYQVTTA